MYLHLILFITTCVFASTGASLTSCLLLCCCKSCICCRSNLSHRDVSAPPYTRNVIPTGPTSKKINEVPSIVVNGPEPNDVNEVKGSVNGDTIIDIEDPSNSSNSVSPKENSTSEDHSQSGADAVIINVEPLPSEEGCVNNSLDQNDNQADGKLKPSASKESLVTIDSYEMAPNAGILGPTEGVTNEEEVKNKEMQSLRMLGTLSLFVEAIKSSTDPQINDISNEKESTENDSKDINKSKEDTFTVKNTDEIPENRGEIDRTGDETKLETVDNIRDLNQSLPDPIVNNEDVRQDSMGNGLIPSISITNEDENVSKPEPSTKKKIKGKKDAERKKVPKKKKSTNTKKNDGKTTKNKRRQTIKNVNDLTDNSDKRKAVARSRKRLGMNNTKGKSRKTSTQETDPGKTRTRPARTTNSKPKQAESSRTTKRKQKGKPGLRKRKVAPK